MGMEAFRGVVVFKDMVVFVEVELSIRPGYSFLGDSAVNTVSASAPRIYISSRPAALSLRLLRFVPFFGVDGRDLKRHQDFIVLLRTKLLVS